MKYLYILLVSCSLCYGQGSRLQPGGVPTPVPVFDVTTLSNLVQQIVFQVTSNTVYNIVTNISQSNNISFVVFSNSVTTILTNIPSILEEYSLFPSVPGTFINQYILDFGRKDTNNQPIIYAHLLATNDCYIAALTNLVNTSNSPLVMSGGMLSFDVIASNANRVMYFPTNIFRYPNFKTNSWTVSGTNYVLTLTNGNELRVTCRTNSVAFSITWQTFGQ